MQSGTPASGFACFTDAPWAFAASPANDDALDPAYLARALADEHFAIFTLSASSVLG
jgi:hypothetical protein